MDFRKRFGRPPGQPHLLALNRTPLVFSAIKLPRTSQMHPNPRLIRGARRSD